MIEPSKFMVAIAPKMLNVPNAPPVAPALPLLPEAEPLLEPDPDALLDPEPDPSLAEADPSLLPEPLLLPLELLSSGIIPAGEFVSILAIIELMSELLDLGLEVQETRASEIRLT